MQAGTHSSSLDGTGAHTRRRERQLTVRGYTHMNHPPTAKAVYGVGGGCAVNWFSILGGSRYHFGRRWGETTAPSTYQFGNTARSIGSPAPIHPTLPARTHPLQRELGARSHRSYRSGRGVSASAKFGCRLQTQPHQPSCRLAPTLVASRHRSAHPKTGAPAHGQRIPTQNHPPTAKAVYGVGGGCAVNWFSILGGS